MNKPATLDRLTQPESQLARTEPEHHTPLVLLESVSRHFGRGRSRCEVLRDLNLAVPGGTAIWVGGRNGAGKTTLLRIITGILMPDEGVVSVEGLRPERNWREYHRRIGFLSAGDRGLYARLSVRAHFEYWSALTFVPRSRRKQEIERALDRFGLAELADRRSERLSQGQRQRVRLALTLVHEPRVLLLDEPRNSLDAEGLDMLSAAVDDVVARGGAVIWCSPPREEQPISFQRELMLEEGALRPA